MKVPGEASWQTVIRVLRERAGLSIPASRLSVVREATRRVAARSGIADVHAYAEGLLEGRVSLADLLDEVTIGETYFFREPKQFAFLRDVALPTLLSMREPGHVLRLWSAGCASGEEAYSLAILATDLGLAARTTVLGTDISRQALIRANAASYGKWSMRDRGLSLSQHHVLRSPDDRTFTVSSKIRQIVRFARLNLSSGDFGVLAGSPGFDLILCRNVLIYFDAEAIARVALGLCAALAPGGYLILGSSDPSLAGLAAFDLIGREEGTFYRRPPLGSAPRLSIDFHTPVALAEREPTPPPARPARPAREYKPYDDVDEPTRSARVPPRPTPTVIVEGKLDPFARIRAVSGAGDLASAERAIVEALAKTPSSAELHHAHALVLAELGRLDEALASIRRALYLAPNLVMLNLTQGVLLTRKGDSTRARASFRTVRKLCAALEQDAEVPLSDGLTVRYIDGLAAAHLGQPPRTRQVVQR